MMKGGVEMGPGLWKLNCLLLEKEGVLEGFRQEYAKRQTCQDLYNSRSGGKT